MPDYGFHNNISSYECGSGVSFDFCTNPNGSCAGDYGSDGAGHVRSPHVGHNDEFDRLFLRKYDAAEQGAVVAFRKGDCTSDSGRFLSSTDGKTIYYSLSDMNLRHIGNNAISSIMIPQGYAVTLYQYDGFRGDSITMHGPTWSSTNNYQLVCQDMPKGWNNTASSLSISLLADGKKAVGKWISHTATESIEFTYNVGYHNTKSET